VSEWVSIGRYWNVVVGGEPKYSEKKYSLVRH